MGKVWGFVMFIGTLALGILALAFVVRNFAPAGLASLFSFERA